MVERMRLQGKFGEKAQIFNKARKSCRSEVLKQMKVVRK